MGLVVEGETLHCGWCGGGCDVIAGACARTFRSEGSVEEVGCCCWVRRSSHFSCVDGVLGIYCGGGGAGVVMEMYWKS